MDPWRDAQWVSFDPSARAYGRRANALLPSLKLRRPTEALGAVGAKDDRLPSIVA
jgi:hypothetical protein